VLPGHRGGSGYKYQEYEATMDCLRRYGLVENTGRTCPQKQFWPKGRTTPPPIYEPTIPPTTGLPPEREAGFASLLDIQCKDCP